MVNKKMYGRIKSLEKNVATTTTVLESQANHMKNLEEILTNLARNTQKITSNQEKRNLGSGSQRDCEHGGPRRVVVSDKEEERTVAKNEDPKSKRDR